MRTKRQKGGIISVLCGMVSATDTEVVEQYERFKKFAKVYDTIDTRDGPMTRDQLKKLLVPQHSEQEVDWLVDGLLDEQERTREREVKAAALEKNAAGTYTESRRASNVSSEAPLRDSGRQNVTYDPEQTAFRTSEDAEKLPEQEVSHASADSEIESLAFETKPISSRELGVPGGTDRQNIRLVEWGETEATWMARQMAEHQGLKLVLFVGGDLEIAHNGKTVRTQSYMDADNVYIRADHPVYTAEQLMQYEIGSSELSTDQNNKFIQGTNIDSYFGRALGVTGKNSEAHSENYFSVDPRDKLQNIRVRDTMKLSNGFACFPEGDSLIECVRKVDALEGFFDVAMHGTPTAVCFGGKDANMSPRMLAAIIRHNKQFKGQKIRLLSCSTGKENGDNYCFAEELANVLGVEVVAPNDILYISERGVLTIGELGEGKFETFKPNQRRRIK